MSNDDWDAPNDYGDESDQDDDDFHDEVDDESELDAEERDPADYDSDGDLITFDADYESEQSEGRDFVRSESLTPNTTVSPYRETQPSSRLGVTISGVTHSNDDGVNRQLIAATLTVGQSLLLKQEPKNQFDRFAVAVTTTTGRQVGYIPKEISRAVSNALQEGTRITAVVSKVKGGGDLKFGIDAELLIFGNLTIAPLYAQNRGAGVGSISTSNPKADGCSALFLATFVAIIFFVTSLWW